MSSLLVVISCNNGIEHLKLWSTNFSPEFQDYRVGACPSVCHVRLCLYSLSVCLSRFNGGRLEPKRMGGFCSNLVCRYMTIWSSAFWGFHGGRAKCRQNCISMAVSWSRSVWTDYIQIWFVDAWIHGLVPFEGFMAVAKVARNIIAKIVAKIFVNVFSQIWCRVVKRYDIVAFIGFCWGFHGGRAKIVAKMSPKLHFNGGQLEPKCVDGLYSNLVCRCMNPWASAFWGFHGGRAKIGAKVARNIIAKIVAKISTNVFSSDMM